MTDWRPDRPYNELPAPPDADRLETRKVLKAAIVANTALGQLDQAVVSIPNPTVLINSLPVLEAQASSEIENIVTTTDELFRHLSDDANADPATRETLRYRTALQVGFEMINDRGLTTATASAVCSTIKGREMKIRAVPGTRIGNPVTGELPTARRKDAMSSPRSSPHGNDSSTPTTASTRSCGWRLLTTNSRRFIHSQTATAEPAASSTC